MTLLLWLAGSALCLALALACYVWVLTRKGGPAEWEPPAAQEIELDLWDRATRVSREQHSETRP